jgi:hypothetical protein
VTEGQGESVCEGGATALAETSKGYSRDIGGQEEEQERAVNIVVVK